MNCVTLLTDFGLVDEYVGVMKGVIMTIYPAAAIVDLCHEIPPQDIAAAARMLRAAYPYFPGGTIHVCVVDPGVGTDRAVLAARADGHCFVGPDNGVLFPLLQEAAVEAVVRAERSEYFLPEISRTFHGRDIFAPVAAHLLRGVPVTALGRIAAIDELVPLVLSAPQTGPDGTVAGTIINADRFGNLLTDIEHRHIAPLADAGTSIEIRVGDVTISGLSPHYGRPDGKTCRAVIGSRGHLEIAVSGGSARRRLQLRPGDPVVVRRKASDGMGGNP
jgi:S-adenosylmethionine hydrolase